MFAKKLIVLVAFVMLITLLEQIKSGVNGRMAKTKKAGRVKVIHTGPRVRKLKKKVEELKKQLASLGRCEPCESAKTEGIIFKSPGESNDYLDAGSWGKPLDALTSCIWVKFKDSSRDMDCVFNNRALDLAMVRYKKDLTFFGGNFKLSSSSGKYIHFNEWSHYCSTMEPGEMKVYINGTLEGKFQLKGAIGVEGNLVYGQCYFMDSRWSSFIGEMAGINVWDRVLSEQEIFELSKSCSVGKGNIVSMVDLKVMGGAQMQKIPVFC